jgi:hypothetical protein
MVSVWVSSLVRHVALLLSVLMLSSCGWDGHFSLFGYSTLPNYDTNIHTVRLPIFKNNTFYRGLEFELTRAVEREIQSKTPWRVVGQDCPADTELTGTIVNLVRNVVNRNPNNELRDVETIMTVEIVWRDLRTGEILSKPRPKPGPDGTIPPPPKDKPPPVVAVGSVGAFRPELGESLTTAQKANIDRLAVQIVSLMEAPW